MVLLGANPEKKEDAIRQAGEMLVTAGCVAPAYVDGMLARERFQTTYLGHGVVISHGQRVDLQFVYRTGISVMQIPSGIEWMPGEYAHLVLGLASKDDQHIDVLANLVALLQSPGEIELLIHTDDPSVIVETLTRGRSKRLWN